MDASLSLNRLPNKIILMISKHLEPYDLTRLAQTCKQFLHLLTDEIDKVAAFYEWDVLGWAILSEFFPFAERLLQRGADPNGKLYPEMYSPFQLAVQMGHRKMVERFIKAGAQVDDIVVFSMAASSGCVDMVRLLADNAGNDPHSKHFANAIAIAHLFIVNP